MANSVEYSLSLKDALTSKLKDADVHAKSLEGTMHTLKGTLGALGIAAGVSSIAHYFESAVESAHKLHEAEALVRAGIESTGGAAKVSFEHLEESASKFSSVMKYSKADVMDLQSQLLTFGGVTKENFDSITQATLNVAARVHRGTTEMAIMMGKAFDNPAEGLRKLMRTGVMFDANQQIRIKQLTEQGKLVEAQQVMLAEIQNKYGGSAQAIFNADPAAQYQKAIGALKREIGESAIEMEKMFIPVIQWFAKIIKQDIIPAVKNFMNFMKEHPNILKTVAIGVGALTASFLLLKLGILDIGAAIKANPLGALITAITLVTAGIEYLYDKFEGFRAFMDGIAAGIKEVTKVAQDFFDLFSLQKINPKNGYVEGMKMGKDLKTAFNHKDPTERQAFSVYARLQGLEDTEKNFKAFKNKMKGSGDADFKARMAASEDKGSGGKSSKGAAGTKSVTVNIKIDSLIKEFKMGVTNITEGAQKIGQIITEHMLSAVNDSQIVAQGI